MRNYTNPMIIDALGEAGQTCKALEALPLRIGSGAVYDEGWLQSLIQAHPALLPIEVIEPGLAQPVPICMELPLPSGSVDNLMITRGGGLVVVETKLWRNPQSRREVVGQVLDYAKDLSRFHYTDLEHAVRRALKKPELSIFDLVHKDGAPHEEATFIDSVSRNLRLGRMLLIIAGDGIQESAELLTDFLQIHMGLHFTLAMVEMSLWREPLSGLVLVQPRLLTRTYQIERAVVRAEEGLSINTSVVYPEPGTVTKRTTLTSETYFETIAKHDQSLPPRLKAFLDELDTIAVYPEFRKFMNLQWQSPSGTRFNLGGIDTEARFNGEYVNWGADAIGRLDLAHNYNEALAKLLPVGGHFRKTTKPTGWRVVAADGRSPAVSDLLDIKEAWMQAMVDYISGLEQTLREREQRGEA